MVYLQYFHCHFTNWFNIFPAVEKHCLTTAFFKEHYFMRLYDLFICTLMLILVALSPFYLYQCHSRRDNDKLLEFIQTRHHPNAVIENIEAKKVFYGHLLDTLAKISPHLCRSQDDIKNNTQGVFYDIKFNDSIRGSYFIVIEVKRNLFGYDLKDVLYSNYVIYIE